jgi:hypothetical protein
MDIFVETILWLFDNMSDYSYKKNINYFIAKIAKDAYQSYLLK